MALKPDKKLLGTGEETGLVPGKGNPCCGISGMLTGITGKAFGCCCSGTPFGNSGLEDGLEPKPTS
jgi:hypothetical protein